MEHNAKELLAKYRLGTCTPEEQALVERFLNKQVADSELMPSAEGISQSFSRLDNVFARQLKRSRRTRILRWLPYAAAVLLVASVVGYFAVDSRKSAADSLAATDIQPGGNRATLTLADGRTVDLSSEQEGIVVNDEDITYSDGSFLEAVMLNENEASLPNSGDAPVMLALTTPKGGTYQVTLPDGSKVWLNANSTLKYPSRFTGDTREVILEGEAYFEIVAMDRARNAIARERSGSGARVSRVPFKVQTSGQTVEVLGTQFNISAYADEAETKTTLVEGKVKVTPGTEKGSPRKGLSDFRTSGLPDHVLTPGQQATTRGSETQVIEVNTEQYTSWKDGYFSLKGTIPDILKEISRWYDLDVVYEGKPTDSIRVYFTIPRDLPLADVLYALQQADGELRYRLEAVTDGSKTQHHQRQAERRLTIFR